ncbi:flagellar basal body P-ring protein FlgI [Candidatus Aerophobetes bacterium]|nr:flagellar basal body P-ring protein FlgI [Candidatus Aerophobetes bacterium]
MKKFTGIFLCIVLFIVSSVSFATEIEVRIKDLTRLQDVKEIQLFGYGLVVGLNGTGDKRGAVFTVQSISNMLQNMGIAVDPEKLSVKNCAAVIVTSKVSVFNRPGSRIDVMVSSLGNATSLEGGTLLLTPLQSMDGKVYAVAQGPVSIGGFNVEAGGTSSRKNHPTVGRIPAGGIVQRSPVADIPEEEINFVLSHPDFTTATRICEAINKNFSKKLATAVDASLVKVKIPEDSQGEKLAGFISTVQDLTIIPESVARVVINERTGTIVVGSDVRISPVAVAHGGLLVTIETTPIISQPPPFSQGETKVEEQKKVKAEEQKGRIAVLEGTTVEELVKSLNALGVTPRDMIAIFQALKEAGALQAELVIM